MKTLAVSWNTSVVRFVLGESAKGNAVRVLQSGERSLSAIDVTDSDADAPLNGDGDESTALESHRTDEPAPSDDLPAAILMTVQSIVRETKASKARLAVCLNRGLIDATSFNVPPADTAELPVIVRNMTSRQLPGVSEDSLLDFIPDTNSDGTVSRVTAMTLPRPEQDLIERLAKDSGCAVARAIVVTHPLRLFVQPDDDDHAVSLIISKGRQSGHLLLVRDGMPITSRSLRLPHGLKGDDEALHLASEVQRTLLTVEADLEQDIEITEAVVIGAEMESGPLQAELSSQLGMDVRRVSATSVVEGEVGEAAVNAFAPLVAACAEEALGTPPAVDFLNPRKPPKAISGRQRMLAIVATALLLIGGGWYYVNSMFAEARAENVRLKERSRELDELVKDTRSKRNLAKVLTAWDSSRLSWLDELRDLTIRTPSSPDLTIDQFSAASSGRDFVVSFRGTSKRPDVIRAMEVQLRDKYHSPKTPGIREIRNGKESSWSFQTTMKVRNRPKSSFVSHIADNESPSSTTAIATKAKPVAPQKKEQP